MSRPGAPAQDHTPTTDLAERNRIRSLFARKRIENRAALIFFLTAGHPDVESTLAAIEGLEAGGADLIELGIPFSDPIADGPTIQKSSQRALEAGMTVAGVLKLVRRIRERSSIPLVLFTGYNPIFRYGEARFAADAAGAGADGVIIPDLPPEEAGGIEAAAHEHGLETIFLAAPTTTPERFSLIADHSTGFLYYVSLRGVTGARAGLPDDLRDSILRMKGATALPLAVGFGIASPDQAREVASVADGVVVGSALVRLIDEEAGRPEFATRIRDYARSLSGAIATAR